MCSLHHHNWWLHLWFLLIMLLLYRVVLIAMIINRSGVEVFHWWACLSERVFVSRDILVINCRLLLYLLPTQSPLITTIIHIMSIFYTILPDYHIPRSRCWPRHWPYCSIVICNDESWLSLYYWIVGVVLYVLVYYYSLIIIIVVIVNCCVYLLLLW